MRLTELFEWFKETREYRKIATNSKIMYDQMMNHALNYFPVKGTVESINDVVVDKWYDGLVEQGKTSKAVAIMKVMRRIWNVAKRKGLVKVNPFEKMGLSSIAPRTELWTRELAETFRLRALAEGKKHIALLVDMCYHLGIRPGDVIGLKTTAFNRLEDLVVVKQQKTKKIVSIPVYQPFKGRLVAALNSEWSKRWGTFLPQYSYSQYSKDYRFIRDLLGLPKSLQLRDLRRTALSEILNSGASDAEAQSISSHSDRDLNAMLNTYSPITVKMARSAMRKRFQIED